MRIDAFRVMAVVFAATAVGSGCTVSAPDEQVEHVDTDVPVHTGDECTKPNVGPAPSSCQQDNDCAWSECSVSVCVDGVCVHKEALDGSVCPAAPLGTGTCRACLCVVET